MIKNPCCAGGQVRWRARLVQQSIDVKSRDVRFPLDGEGVEIIGKLLTVGQGIGCAYAVPARVTRPMKSAMNDRRFLTNVFHDVDLAAGGPAGGTHVVTQHPKCRPKTLAVRDPNARLEPSIGLTELILSEQSCRSVIASYVVSPGEGLL